MGWKMLHRNIPDLGALRCSEVVGGAMCPAEVVSENVQLGPAAGQGIVGVFDAGIP